MNTDQRLDRLEKRVGINDEPKTYSAQEARVKMGEGYRVDVQSCKGWYCWYLDGTNTLRLEGDVAAFDEQSFLRSTCRYVTHNIHPKADVFAMQRLKADGLVVGSVVRVLRGWAEGEGGCCLIANEAPLARTIIVASVGETVIGIGDNAYPAHVLEIISNPAHPGPPEGYVWLLEGGERVNRPVLWNEFYVDVYSRVALWPHYIEGSQHYILTRMPDKGTLAWAIHQCFEGKVCVSKSCKIQIRYRKSQRTIWACEYPRHIGNTFFLPLNITAKRNTATDWEVQDES